MTDAIFEEGVNETRVMFMRELAATDDSLSVIHAALSSLFESLEQ